MIYFQLPSKGKLLCRICTLILSLRTFTPETVVTARWMKQFQHCYTYLQEKWYSFCTITIAQWLSHKLYIWRSYDGGILSRKLLQIAQDIHDIVEDNAAIEGEKRIFLTCKSACYLEKFECVCLKICRTFK